MDPGHDAKSVPLGPAAVERLLTTLRPKLHRYCARMVGSVIDADDVVQEASMKAIQAAPRATGIDNIEAWLFRIAHNAAIDHLRRRARHQGSGNDEDLAMLPDPVDEIYQRQAAAAALKTLMRLPVAQRSSVILMDVLGYSLEEIGAITGSTIPAVKAALHRGRLLLQEVANEPDDVASPLLDDADRRRLSSYVELFNARDFDAIRSMLADDVKLDLVNRTRMNGRKEVSRYFGNYASVADWRFHFGFVDRHPAIIVRDPNDSSGRPIYFILIDWVGGEIGTIRDFRHAQYEIDRSEIVIAT